MHSTRDNSSLASGFIASMRECMPDTAPVRETLSFIGLVLHHPSPPRDIVPMQRSLWNLVTMNTDAQSRRRADASRGELRTV